MSFSLPGGLCPGGTTAGGGELNMGGWLPPPGAFGWGVYARACVGKRVIPADMHVHYTMQIMQRTVVVQCHACTRHVSDPHKWIHLIFTLYYNIIIIIILYYLHEWYELGFCLCHVWFWVWLSWRWRKTARRTDVYIYIYNHSRIQCILSYTSLICCQLFSWGTWKGC